VTLRLLHRPNSRSARVRWLLEDIGAPYELVPVSDEEKASEEYRSRHPLGRVPVLETDEGIVFETLAVCVHLAEQYPEASLLPAPGSFDRALVFQWISLGLTEVEPHLGEMRRAEESAPELAEAARGRARATVGVLDAALADREFLVGARFTLADLLCGSALFAARRAELVSDAPAVEAYLARLEGRPARQRAYAPD